MIMVSAPIELRENELITTQANYIDVNGNMPEVDVAISVRDIVFLAEDLKEGKWLLKENNLDVCNIINIIKSYKYGWPGIFITK